MSRTVAIIGAGVVGTAVGRLLRERGYAVRGVVARSMDKARRSAELIGAGEPGTDAAAAAKGADWVLITTPDRAIKEACDAIADRGCFGKGALVVHFSGALGSDVLGAASGAGARTASVHPMQSLASVEQAVANLPGSYFSVEGEPDAMAEAAELVEALGGLRLVIPSDQKALYHAGAAIASNYLVAVVELAVEVYEALGISREEATRAVLPLIRGTVNNIARVGVPDALTGPIARGDIATVEGHLEVLKKTMPKAVRLYCELGKKTVQVGMAKGTLSREDGDKLLELFGRKV